jgi:U3 small nucleolar RNA-associated protein 23
LTSQQEEVLGLSAEELRALGVDEREVRDVYKVRTNVKFKKKAGGKNPLSCLKKKQKASPAPTPTQGGEKKKRARRKKKNSE